MSELKVGDKCYWLGRLYYEDKITLFLVTIESINTYWCVIDIQGYFCTVSRDSVLPVNEITELLYGQ